MTATIATSVNNKLSNMALVLLIVLLTLHATQAWTTTSMSATRTSAASVTTTTESSLPTFTPRPSFQLFVSMQRKYQNIASIDNNVFDDSVIDMDKFKSTFTTSVSIDSLMDMDVVIFSINGNDKCRIGAIEEKGLLAPLSAWTAEPVFGDEYLELLVDEHDRFPGYKIDDENIKIIAVVQSEDLSYGSRQVGGGKGPGNPHGEESELLYYVKQSVLKKANIELPIKPSLEITW